MTLSRRPARLTAWIAIFAVLLAALAPGLARALSSPQKAMPWSEICSVGGPRAAPDALPDSGAGQHDGKVFKHCPFCLNHAGHFALPATPLDFALAIDSGATQPCSSLTTSASRFACTSPQSRAPPAFS
jgi:hypothetical protein